MTEWRWEEGSVLYSDSPYTPPKEIFQAVCNELGRYYSQNGVKYTKSNRKIKWNLGLIRFETTFWSSGSNTAGEWVNLEIVSNVYTADANGMEKGGLLYFYIRPENFNVYGIDDSLFFKIIGYIDETLELVKSFTTSDGIRNYCSESEFVNEHPNNRAYFNRLEQ